MNNDAELLTEILKANPGQVYITESGMTIFCLVGPEEKLMHISSMGKSFKDMTDEEINEVIKKCFS